MIRLKVHPASKKNLIVKKADDAYEVWIKAPAENGRANESALTILASALGQPVKKLRIIKGVSSPNKIVTILGGKQA